MKILWIPHIAWYVPQRAHLFCRALSEKYEVHVTDWIADFVHIQDLFSRRYIRNFTYRQYMDANIRVHGIPRISPALFFAPFRRLNNWLFARTVRKIIEKNGIDVVVGTFVCPPPDAPRLVFDLFDDNTGYWRAYGMHRAYANEIEATESAYLKKADAVVASSSVLVEMAKQRGACGPVHFIPNGVEVALYKSSDGTDWRKRLGLKGTVVGVLGNHDKPAEMEKILMAAQILRDDEITFVVVGRGTALPFTQKRAISLGLQHIHFTGPVSRDEVPDILAAFDVGICPYLKTPGADAGSPMRLLQYSAAGLPTVCTELEEARRMSFSNVILVADNVPALVDGIRQAVKLPRRAPDEISAYDLPILVQHYEAVLKGVL